MAGDKGKAVVPEGYQVLLGDLKERIRAAQVRAALSVNRELILLYWRIGQAIRERQETHGWGAQVINRLSADLRLAFPDMKGFSPRNLQYMRTFAGVYLDPEIAQQLLRDLPWGHITHLLDRVSAPNARDWYARQAIAHGWSRAMLLHHIESKLYQRQGHAQTNFEMNFYLSAVDDLLRHPDDQPTIGIILCKSKNKVVAEYALRDVSKPIGVSAYKLMEALPADLPGSLPTIEELEATLGDAEDR